MVVLAVDDDEDEDFIKLPGVPAYPYHVPSSARAWY